jgi:hypothetical protein
VADLCCPEGTLLVGGEFVCTFTGEYAQVHQVAHLELPATHELLMIALERLMVPCISDRCLPSSLVDEVDVIILELVLCGFIVCLDMVGAYSDFQGMTTSAPYTKKKDVSPMARLGDVRLAHNTHGSSSIHLAPCFFKQS